MQRLKDKNILITGASEGLGRQLAVDFALAGAAGIAVVARRGAKLDDLRQYLVELNPALNVVVITADLSRPADIERVAATALDSFGGKLDVLINNASILGPSPMPMLVDYPVHAFEQVISTNLLAPFLLIQKLLPALLRTSGSIINVTSDAGVTGYPGWGAYGISKFGIEGLSQTWAAELEDTGVRVNWVDPGNMNTTMHRLAEPDEDPNDWADPSEVTAVFVLLASDEARNIHGQRIRAQETTDIAAAS
jgi:NAD(P)-dependent dehydrogenase (short-subunit alcohol dehydrogenase family)